jgi:NhaP-type Na+/H+ or K+/H+ antiporter
MLLGLASIFVLGVGAQWLAWRIKLPSILLLLAFGFAAGPGTGWLKPDDMFGDLLFPIVSLSVALILFEGSLSLKFSELAEVGKPLRNLLSIGVGVTWFVITLAAWWILRFDFATALLLGAMLTVTGPTVVGPLLRHIRPSGKVSSIARWEGIVIDPIGAVLAVLVFEVFDILRDAHFGEAVFDGVFGLLATAVTGVVMGGLAAWFLIECLQRYWIPERLQSPAALMIVAAVFVASNLVKHEAGLISVTVMGVFLANQKSASIKHIFEFKENLSVLLISSLFILLAARVEFADFSQLGWRGLAFVTAVILIARPASVLASSIGTDLSKAEQIFLSWLAPRGIVAAAVASVFALRMEETGNGGGELVPATFLVIVGTVVVYGLTAFPLAKRLGLASADAQGVLIASSHPGARAIGHALKSSGFRVVLVDTNRENVTTARLEGLEACYANILSEQAMDEIDLGGIGRFFALTPTTKSTRFRRCTSASCLVSRRSTSCRRQRPAALRWPQTICTVDFCSHRKALLMRWIIGSNPEQQSKRLASQKNSNMRLSAASMVTPPCPFFSSPNPANWLSQPRIRPFPQRKIRS